MTATLALPVHPFTGLRALGRRCDGRPIWPVAGGDDTTNPVLARLELQREEQVRFIDETLTRVQAEERDLVDAETRNLEAAKQRIGEIDAQLTPLREFEALRTAHRSSSAGYRPTRAQQAGGDGPQERRTSLGMTAEPRAQYRSAGEVIVDRIRAYDGDRDAADRLRAHQLVLAGEQRVHQLTDDTPGVLPEPIVGQIVADIDATRPFVVSVGGARDLAGIPGKQFSRPVVTQHTQVGKQATEKTELASRKLTISGVDFVKETWGGWLNISRQEIDWTAPAVWDAIIRDLQEQYAIETENASADAFATAVTQATAAVATDDLAGWTEALYAAASLAYRGGAAPGAPAAGRLPDRIWVSLDMWARLGAIVDQARLLLPPGAGGDTAGTSRLDSFAGNLFMVPRVVVPSFPDGTIIVGNSSRTEVYEQRVGLLQAVEPSVLGVQVAYAGYFAYGTLLPGSYAKVTQPI